MIALDRKANHLDRIFDDDSLIFLHLIEATIEWKTNKKWFLDNNKYEVSHISTIYPNIH